MQDLTTIVKNYRNQIQHCGHQHDYGKICEIDQWIFDNIGLELQQATDTQMLSDDDPYPYYYSFVAMWFFQENGRFLNHDKGNKISYQGLLVAVHRDLPFYTYMMGTITWEKANTDVITQNCFLNLNDIKTIYHQPIASLIAPLTEICTKNQLTYLSHSDLSKHWYEKIPLDEMLEFRKKPTYFDALFFQYEFHYANKSPKNY